MDNIAAVEEAIRLAGSQSKLARLIGVSQVAICKAKKTGRISARMASGIDAATRGKVAKSSLRPDLWPPADAPSIQKEHAA